MEKIKMVITITRRELNRLLALVFTPLLIAILVTAAIEGLQSNSAPTNPISESITAATIGGDWGACAILVGLAIGVVAAGAGAYTLGFGGALVISAGAHFAGYMCAYS
jgi:beta-glucosidase-like glycosyl hydrolase